MSRERTETMAIGRAKIRVTVRPGTGDGVPLLLCNGIGAQQEVLTPFVDALDPRITAIRWDVPGVGGSSMPKVPLPYAVPCLDRRAAGARARL